MTLEKPQLITQRKGWKMKHNFIKIDLGRRVSIQCSKCGVEKSEKGRKRTVPKIYYQIKQGTKIYCEMYNEEYMREYGTVNFDTKEMAKNTIERLVLSKKKNKVVKSIYVIDGNIIAHEKDTGHKFIEGSYYVLHRNKFYQWIEKACAENSWQYLDMGVCHGRKTITTSAYLWRMRKLHNLMVRLKILKPNKSEKVSLRSQKK